MAGANVMQFDDTNFETEVLQSATPVLVDFWAEWCGPCQMLAPTIDELATDLVGKVKVGKLNVDHAPGVAARYGVQSIPTVILFNGGQSVERIVGARKKTDYRNVIAQKLGAL